MNGTAVSMPAGRGTSMALRLARDDRLARLAASGDSRAFAVVYERYHQPIYRYCHSILHDPDDAADALQNAMLKAMRGLVGSERDIALKPWLFRIAHNEAISLVRRRRPTSALEAIDEPLGHSTDEDAATRERLGQLVEDLRELPDRQRGALLMRELAGLGFHEIAQIFDVSPAAAKQTVYEARTALHEYADGRQMQCEDARQSLSAGDRRMLRGRKLAAHLRDCASCRDFQEVMRLRRRDVAALAPPISAGVSAAILQGIVGGSGGGAGGGGLLAWLTGGGAKVVLGSEAAKSLLAAALVTASAGALGVVSALQAPQGGIGSAGQAHQASDVRAAPDAMALRTFNPSPAGATSRPAPAKRRSSRATHSHAVSSPASVSYPASPTTATAVVVSHRGGSSGSAPPPTIGVAIPSAPSTDTPAAPSLPQLSPPTLAETAPSLPAEPTIASPMLDFVAGQPALPMP